MENMRVLTIEQVQTKLAQVSDAIPRISEAFQEELPDRKDVADELEACIGSLTSIYKTLRYGKIAY